MDDRTILLYDIPMGLGEGQLRSYLAKTLSGRYEIVKHIDLALVTCADKYDADTFVEQTHKGMKAVKCYQSLCRVKANVREPFRVILKTLSPEDVKLLDETGACQKWNKSKNLLMIEGSLDHIQQFEVTVKDIASRDPKWTGGAESNGSRHVTGTHTSKGQNCKILENVTAEIAPWVFNLYPTFYENMDSIEKTENVDFGFSKETVIVYVTSLDLLWKIENKISLLALGAFRIGNPTISQLPEAVSNHSQPSSSAAQSWQTGNTSRNSMKLLSNKINIEARHLPSSDASDTMTRSGIATAVETKRSFVRDHAMAPKITTQGASESKPPFLSRVDFSEACPSEARTSGSLTPTQIQADRGLSNTAIQHEQNKRRNHQPCLASDTHTTYKNMPTGAGYKELCSENLNHNSHPYKTKSETRASFEYDASKSSTKTKVFSSNVRMSASNTVNMDMKKSEGSRKPTISSIGAESCMTMSAREEEGKNEIFKGSKNVKVTASTSENKLKQVDLKHNRITTIDTLESVARETASEKTKSLFTMQEQTSPETSMICLEENQSFSQCLEQLQLSKRTYNGILVSIFREDITRIRTDVIVNAANGYLSHDGGVARAISCCGGPVIQRESTQYTQRHGPLPTGGVCFTSGGDLPCQYVIHAVGPAVYHGDDLSTATECLQELVVRVLDVAANGLGARSIAFPAISTGIYGLPIESCASAFHHGITEYSVTRPSTSIEEINIVIKDEDGVGAFIIEFFTDLEQPIAPVTNDQTSIDHHTAHGFDVDSRGSNQASLSTEYLSIKDDAYSMVNEDGRHSHVDDSNDDGVGYGVEVCTENQPINASSAKAIAPASISSDIADTLRAKGDCEICTDSDMTLMAMRCCQNTMCHTCFRRHFELNGKCPFCSLVVLVKRGNQPTGEMESIVEDFQHLPGYERDGAIVLSYHFPDGIQTTDHPNPGQPYSGTYRRAYLPNNREGQQVRTLLRKAFDLGLLFTIGKSVTTGVDNCVIWNDVHHKTSRTGGPQGYGYPDPTYLDRVKEELAAKGIK